MDVDVDGTPFDDTNTRTGIVRDGVGEWIGQVMNAWTRFGLGMIINLIWGRDLNLFGFYFIFFVHILLDFVFIIRFVLPIHAFDYGLHSG